MISTHKLYKDDTIKISVRYIRPGDPEIYSKEVFEFKILAVEGAAVTVEWIGSLKDLWEDLGLDHLSDL